MSLGNDPSNTPGPVDPEECRYCHRRTYDSRRICPDCREEGVNEEPEECECWNCETPRHNGTPYCEQHKLLLEEGDR